MRTSSFKGKEVDLTPAGVASGMGLGYSYYPPGKYHDSYGCIEIYLSEFECPGRMDQTGRNAYSVVIHLDGNRIVNIVRIGHCHMCHGQGADDELRLFPHRSLEVEAQKVLDRLTGRK